jgi:hypothetical protein
MSLYTQNRKHQCNQKWKCCHGNVKIHSFCIAALHIDLNYVFVVILYHQEQRMYMGPHIKCSTFWFNYNGWIITKLRFSQLIFTEVSNIKFHKNLSSGGWTDTCRQMDTHIKASRHLSCVCESISLQLEMRMQTASKNSPPNICTNSSGYGAH